MKKLLKVISSSFYRTLRKKLHRGHTFFFALLFLFVFISSSVFGQDYSLTMCSHTIGTNTYGPMYSSTIANYGNRTAFIIDASQLTSIAGNTLSSIWFNRIAATGSLTGTTNFKIYLKNTTLADFGSGNLTWATEISGATNVFDADPTANVGSTAGMKQFPFSTNFTYTSGNNLAVYLEYTQTIAQSAAITWDYEYGSPCINTANSNTTKYWNGATPLSATTTSSNYRRPIIAFSLVSNMSFVSATTTQASIANIYTGSNGNPIVGLQVVTSGSTSPLSLTQLSMVATGTNPTADISKIHVYYTGTSSTFAATNAFDGVGTNVTAGNININGSQTLANGINYFWIAYDVSATATSGNTLDARLLASPTTSLVVGGVAQTVTANDPAGSRTISATCVAPTAQPTT
ncbi:MAG: BNR-repeat neuraminidase N-terminal domain-containing protein, partial [Bacteroidota bacterium]